MITLTISGENAKEFMQDLAEFLSVKNKPAEPVASENGVATEEPKTRKPRTSKEEKPVAPVVPTDTDEDDGLGDPPVVTHTVESIRALAKDRATAVGADKVRGLIQSMGFAKLPELTADKYAEFADKVAKLTK